MNIRLAWANLIHKKSRTFLAVTGITFALSLIFAQFGFLGAVETSATRLFDPLDFDVMVTSTEFVNLSQPGSFPLSRLTQAKAVPGVEQTVPLYLGYHLWKRDPTAPDHSIMIVGFRPSESVWGRLPEVRQNQDQLRLPDTVLLDRLSHPDVEPPSGLLGLSRTTEQERPLLGQRRVKIVGRFTLGLGGLGTDGLVLVSDQTYANIFGGVPLDRCTLGLIKVQHGYTAEEVARMLKDYLVTAHQLRDIRVQTRAEIEASERHYWVWGTPAGVLFFLGSVVSFLVGAIFGYQVISSDLASRLKEFATLKAMGYSSMTLSGIVVQQALIQALLSYPLSFGIALGLYELTRVYARLPMQMTVGRGVLVLVLGVVMCCLSALFALHRVRAADPAELF